MAEQKIAFWKDVTKLDRASLEAAVETYRSGLESIIDLECDWKPDPTPEKTVSDQEYWRWQGLQEAAHVALRALSKVYQT